MRKLFKLNVLKTLILAGLFLFPAIAGAQQNAETDISRRMQGRIAEKLDEKFEKMSLALDLSEDQQVLQEDMKAAIKNYILFKAENKKELRQIFKEEMKKENPNFQAAANRLKTKHQQEEAIGFETMVDAMAVFYDCLTTEQLTMANEQKQERLTRIRQRFEFNNPGN